MTESNPRESISLYRSGKALASKRAGGHITGDYEIIEDSVSEGDVRTIKLKPRDKKEFLAQMKELIELLLDKLGETESKAFRRLLEDTLIDYDDESIMSMLKDMKEGKKPVKTSKGCFDIIIGDGRRKNTNRIIIRE